MPSRLVFVLLGTMLLAGCVTPSETPPALIGRAAMISADGTPVGSAMVYSGAGQATISIALTGLSPGVRSVALHHPGACPVAGSNHLPASSVDAGVGQIHDVTIGEDHLGTVSALFPGTAAQVAQKLFAAPGTAVVVAQRDSDGSGLAVCGVLHAVSTS